MMSSFPRPHGVILPLKPFDNLDELCRKIQSSQNILLTTHRQCDGDGLGAEIALFHGLKKVNKNVCIVNNDRTPKKYRFLEADRYIHYFDQKPFLPFTPDLVLIFDTNDSRLVQPLYLELEKTTCSQIFFIDHHPALQLGPSPTTGSWIDTQAASTGEMAFRLLKKLNIGLDKEIAQALYTSITFDTQIFRFIRNSPISHEIAAELLKFQIEPQKIHKFLFGEQTVEKIKLLSQALGQIEYFLEGKIAILKLHSSDLSKFKLDLDDARDVIDFIMNIETLEAAALFREDGPDFYKLSLRSKGQLEVLDLAESFGGGGHIYAAGAHLRGSYSHWREHVRIALEKKIQILCKAQ